MEASTPVPPPPPPPPPAPSHPSSAGGTVRRPGQLTPGWQIVTVATWVLVVVAWSGVWKASRELGLATWWLGPQGASRPWVVMVLPYLPPAVMVVLGLSNVRRVPWFGLVASAVAAAIGAIDLGHVRRLGLVELLIAAAAAAVSLAGLAGTYRRAPPATVDGRDGSAGR